MAGFSGTSGVPKSYVDDLVAQSTATKVSTSDIVNNLTSTNIDKPLSANMGKILNETMRDVANGSGSMTKGQNVSNIGNVYCRKKGLMCTISAYLVINTSVAGNLEVILTIPEGYRPDANAQFIAFGNYGGSLAAIACEIRTNGEVVTRQGSNNITGYIAIPSVTYPLPDS